MQIEEYTLTYAGPRMEVDAEKRMLFADVDVVRNGKPAGRVSPAKFIYKSNADAPSTEVAKQVGLRNDLYLIIGMINPQTKVASFQIHVNPLVSFIWLGVGVLIFGALISMWPEVGLEEAGAFGYVRVLASVGTSAMFAILFAMAPGYAYGGASGPQASANASPRAPPPMGAPTELPRPSP
jgi:cytochrome c-type biogenesis protein CcmF